MRRLDLPRAAGGAGGRNWCSIALALIHPVRPILNECFYEKVIKVKADVAALRNLFSDSVTEHSGSASNQVLLETLADATPPLPCFYPHSEWVA